MSIKLFKSSQNVGNGDLNLYQTFFVSKEKIITKWVGLTPVLENLPKKAGSTISTTLASMARVQVKVSINYGQKNENSKGSERTVSQGKNSSRTPDQSKDYKQNLQMPVKSKGKVDKSPNAKQRQTTEETNDLLKVIRGKQPVKNQMKYSNNCISQNTGLLNSDKKETANRRVQTPIEDNKVEELSFKNLDTSVVDEIFTDEKTDIFESPIKDIKDFIEKLQISYTEQYFEKYLS